jgi:hypothetical protein
MEPACSAFLPQVRWQEGSAFLSRGLHRGSSSQSEWSYSRQYVAAHRPQRKPIRAFRAHGLLFFFSCQSKKHSVLALAYSCRTELGPTTIGADAFHDSVRDGKRWDHIARSTRTLCFFYSSVFPSRRSFSFLQTTHYRLRTTLYSFLWLNLG